MSNPVVIKTYFNHPEAELARNFLQKQGIEAFVFESDISPSTPPGMLTPSVGAKLLVRKEDKKEALRLLEQEVEPNE